MSSVCTKHSICIEMICIYVSAPNTRYVFVPHDMHPARHHLRHDTIQFHFDFDTIRYDIMSFVCAKQSICIETICIYVTSPNTQYVFVPHDMHPARHRFDTTRHDTISFRFRYDTIRYHVTHVICLHETLDMY